MNCNILIINARLLENPGSGAITAQGFVAVKGRMISQIGQMGNLPKDFKADKIIDAAGCLVMPGLVNGHCHAAMTLFRGLADDLPLMTWLNGHIFPAEAKYVSKDMVYWCSKLAAAEMILSGTTTVADGYFFEEEAARAFREIGIRAVAAQGIIDFPAPGVPDPAGNIEAAGNYIAAIPADDLVTPALFCHSLYTCSPRTIQVAKQLADECSCKLFIHVAETRAEVKNHYKQYGITPIRHLQKLNILDKNTVCVHCVWLDAAEIAILAKTGCGVITCPESNMKLAAGVAPLADMLAAGVTVGIGTDGCASNNDLDLLGEMASLAKLHKVTSLEPTSMPAGTCLRLAGKEGARALGFAGIGSLRPGMQADIITIDLNQPHLTPFYNPDILVYAASGADVKSSIIGGQLVLENRRLLTIDLEETMAKVRSLARQLA
ncbi:MAG: amidohydrolase [Deltaproteobacteria bacterium]|nr:amidohydrolase [Deltaproteobacteria bacterium]